MAAQMTAAFITATVSLVVALLSAGVALFTARKTRENARALAILTTELERETKRQERADSARAELDRHREPLLRAALDLAHRLDNIRSDAFFDAYLTTQDDRRREIALTSTLYRLGRYWCVVESLYDKVALLRFEEDETTREVAGMLGDIGKTFASDRYERAFMMWREEQRAIAELMHPDTEQSSCIGYATFVERYEGTFAPWFASFEKHLKPSTARNSERFAVVQGQLALLVKELDTRQTYQDQWDRLIRRASSDQARLPDTERDDRPPVPTREE